MFLFFSIIFPCVLSIGPKIASAYNHRSYNRLMGCRVQACLKEEKLKCELDLCCNLASYENLLGVAAFSVS